MNTNLRAMIDDALDGAYAHEQEYGYTETGDLGHVGYSDDGDAVKLAHALNYVATNLNDLGTTEEKIAELELFSEMMKEASGETAATGAADDAAKATGTFGDFYDHLKGGSGKSVSDAWKNLSTGRKWALGGGAGLVGLGALYGGYKMLGGGDSPQNNIVKVSALQDAKMRAFEKVAQRYDIPVWELEKLATSPMLERMFQPTTRNGTAVGFTGVQDTSKLTDQALTDAEASNARLMEGRKRMVSEFGELEDKANKRVQSAYAKLQSGEALTAAEKQQLLEYRRKNPLEANRVKFNKGVHTFEHNGKTYNVAARYQDMSPEDIVAGIKDKQSPIKSVDPKKMQGTATDVATAAQKQQQAAAKARQKRLAKRDAAKAQYQSATPVVDPNTGEALETQGQATARAHQDAKAGRGLGDRMRQRLKGNDAFAKLAPPDKALVESGAVNYLSNGKLTPGEREALRAVYGNNFGPALRADFHATNVEQTRATSRGANRTNRTPNAQSVEIQRAKSTGAAGGAAAKTEAKELGFFAKNRRGLMAAGGLGAAGLAGYGLYRAMSGGQSKAAAFRGFQKIAEDRINPARIRAGAAHNFSGFDIRSHGGGESHFDPVSLRAARVRAKINSDMGSYVSNVGGGYNLERYLNRFNR